MLDRVTRWLVGDRYRDEVQDAREQAEQAEREAEGAEALAKRADEISGRLRSHRAENHFAQRFEAALRERRP